MDDIQVILVLQLFGRHVTNGPEDVDRLPKLRKVVDSPDETLVAALMLESLHGLILADQALKAGLLGPLGPGMEDLKPSAQGVADGKAQVLLGGIARLEMVLDKLLEVNGARDELLELVVVGLIIEVKLGGPSGDSALGGRGQAVCESAERLSLNELER